MKERQEEFPRDIDILIDNASGLYLKIDSVKSETLYYLRTLERNVDLLHDSLDLADNLKSIIGKSNLSHQTHMLFDVFLKSREFLRGPALEPGICYLLTKLEKHPISPILNEKLYGTEWKSKVPIEAQKLVNLTKLYKIHLMPTDEDIKSVTENLINLIKAEKILQDRISNLKIKAMTEPLVTQWKSEGEELTGTAADIPKIVIYVGGGKDDAQTVLNIIYDAFKDTPGIGRAPRWNEKVTDLIYFAQGNADDKIERPEFFEEDKVYFKPDATGVREDYHLINPAHTSR